MTLPAASVPEPEPSRTAFPLSDILAGMRRTLPVGLGVAVYGIVLGVIAAAKGITLAELTLMGALVYAGSSQFVAAELWRFPLPIIEILLATLVMNLRFLLVCAALRPVFAGRRLWEKLVGVHMVVEENWAVAMAEQRRRPITPGFLLGGGLVLLAAWLGACAAGHAMGGLLPEPERLGLDFAFPAAFIFLTIGLYRDRGDVLLWLIAGAVAVAASLTLPGTWFIVLGSLAGAAAAYFRAGKESK